MDEFQLATDSGTDAKNVEADSSITPPPSETKTPDGLPGTGTEIPDASTNGTSFCSHDAHAGCWDFDEATALTYGCPKCWDGVDGGISGSASHIQPPAGPNSEPNSFIAHTTGNSKSYLFKQYKLPSVVEVRIEFDMQPLPCSSTPYIDFVTLAAVRFGSSGIESVRAELSLSGHPEADGQAYGAYAGPPVLDSPCLAGRCSAIGYSPGAWEHVTFDMRSNGVRMIVGDVPRDFAWNIDGVTDMEISLGLRTYPRTKTTFQECEVKFDNIAVDFF